MLGLSPKENASTDFQSIWRTPLLGLHRSQFDDPQLSGPCGKLVIAAMSGRSRSAGRSVGMPI